MIGEQVASEWATCRGYYSCRTVLLLYCSLLHYESVMSGFLSTWVGLLSNWAGLVWEVWSGHETRWAYFWMGWAYFRERGLSKIRRPPSLSSHLISWAYFQEPTVHQCSQTAKKPLDFLARRAPNSVCYSSIPYRNQQVVEDFRHKRWWKKNKQHPKPFTLRTLIKVDKLLVFFLFLRLCVVLLLHRTWPVTCSTLKAT